MARAKGVPERRVKYHQAMRNALLPVLTIFMLNLGFIVSGAVVIEAVVRLPRDWQTALPVGDGSGLPGAAGDVPAHHPDRDRGQHRRRPVLPTVRSQGPGLRAR